MPRSKDDIRTIGALKLQREAMRDHCFRLENKIVERDERIAELLAEVERFKDWKDKAFEAHPNIDIDIDSISGE